MVGLWNGIDTAEKASALQESSKADMIASTLREATRICVEAAGSNPDASRDGLTAEPATMHISKQV